MKRRLVLGAAALGSVASLAGAWSLGRKASDDAGAASASAAGAAGRIPNVPLMTHDGRRVRLYDDLVRGNHIVVFNTTYTRCEAFCAGTELNLVRLQRVLGERMGKSVHIYSLTLDPRFDTPTVLAAHARKIGAGPGWTYLTGREADIDRARRALGFYDRDPAIDRDKGRHSGMVHIGNDALDRWMACPGVIRAEQLAQEVLWVGIAKAA